MRPGERGTAAEQRANLREACAALRPLLGRRARRHARERPAGRQRAAAPGARGRRGAAAAALPRRRADAGRDRRAARERARAGRRRGRSCACSRTCSSPRTTPPSPSRRSRSGRSTTRQQARELERDRGWQVVHDAGRGWRRVVPSPQPLEVVELEAIRSLLASGTIVVAVRRRRHPGHAPRRASRGHRRRDRQGPRLLPARPRARRRAARDPDRGAGRLLRLRHGQAGGAARALRRRGRGAPARSSRPARCGRRSRRRSSSSAPPATRR